MEWIYTLSGLVVGFIVGMTGVGGGSLMTPILLYFGINPATAVGTDLLYAAITKAGGVYVHQKQHNIDWHITLWLALGSVPASLLTVWAMHHIHTDIESLNALIKRALGIALIATALAIILKSRLLQFAQRHAGDWLALPDNERRGITLVVGLVLGVVVTLSSIGAGALGTVALFLLYPLIPTSRLVGTEIAHAVPLTLVAGIGHAGLGNIDWQLLGALLIGSLPGIYLGGKLSGGVSDHYLRPALALMLAVVGTKLVM